MHAIEEKFFKIIIVDENVQFRNTLATKLRMEGFHVEFATGGFHLLHVVEKHWDFNLIILHEDMGDMSAHEIVTHLRSHTTKVQLPILFISGKSTEDEICEMIFNGANEYIVKTANYQPIVDRAKKYFTLLKNS